ncbi:MAG: M20/M25/M40 family metallo-hydrolase, partial [Candidatus Bathyarchaeota archaeon]|nr:M20/M25/M40 family metallo-hydrolase [Candidatus Bathyarchaeota archaeon]
MNKEASVELLRNMLRIYSPSGKEEKLATFLQKELERFGFERVWKDEAGSVYGEIGSGAPTVLLCGHMDTVPGKIAVKTENGHLYGRGAVDAKASLAAMICASSSLGSNTHGGRVVVACVIEEESSARGIRQLLRENLDVDYAVFGEPSGVKNITFAYKGKLGLRITCKTVSGHIGAQHLLDNAIETSFELWDKIKTLSARYKSPHGVFYSLTPCLTHISSERTQGGVPDVCTMDVDLRLPPKIKSGKAVALVEEVVGAFQMANQRVSVSFEITDRVE